MKYMDETPKKFRERLSDPKAKTFKAFGITFIVSSRVPKNRIIVGGIKDGRLKGVPESSL